MIVNAILLLNCWNLHISCSHAALVKNTTKQTDLDQVQPKDLQNVNLLNESLLSSNYSNVANDESTVLPNVLNDDTIDLLNVDIDDSTNLPNVDIDGSKNLSNVDNDDSKNLSNVDNDDSTNLSNVGSDDSTNISNVLSDESTYLQNGANDDSKNVSNDETIDLPEAPPTVMTKRALPHDALLVPTKTAFSQTEKTSGKSEDAVITKSFKPNTQKNINPETFISPDYPGAPYLTSHLSSNAPCTRPGQCTVPTNTSLVCFGTKLAHRSTSRDLTSHTGAWQAWQVEEWAGLRNVPQCWAVVQPLLCAVYMPRCHNQTISLVPYQLCKVAQQPCRVIKEIHGDWPDFLQCDNEKTFSKDCNNLENGKRLRFNTSAICSPPLVATKNKESYFSSINECGVQCRSPLLTDREYDRIHSFVAVTAGLCLAVTVLAVITFLLDWQGANRYPALAIFYINICFAISCIGFLAQFVPGAREDIVCRTDGTQRRAEPGAGENMSCVVVFILVYYFMIASAVWFVVLAYSWYISFEAIGKVKDLIDKKVAYFHMVAWSLPLVLTIIILAMNQVDGSSVTGVCFVSQNNPLVRSLFLLVPFLLSSIVGGYFIVKSISILAKVSMSSDIISDKAATKIQATLMRIGIFSVCILACVVVTISCHMYDFQKKTSWDKSLHSFVLCSLKSLINTNIGASPCADFISDKPSVTLIQLELLCMFGAGILSASWVWTRESLDTWKRSFQQIFSKEVPQRPVKLRKHELIAQAFAKRQDLQAQGRLSLTFQSAHEDPMGMNVSLNSATSGEFSSTWAAALPHLIQRRGAMCGAEQLGLQRRNSLDSINSNFSQSVSIRSGRFSWMDSRRQSTDSQSLQQTDLDRLQVIYDESINKGKKRSKRNFFKAHAGKVRPWSRFSSRRNSTASRNSDNSSVSQVLPAITLGDNKLPGGISKKKPDFKFKIPEPGQSTDFGQDKINPAFDDQDPGFRELEEKLRQLANASRTSQNTDGIQMSLDAAAAGVSPQNQFCSVSVQTSLTDLTSIGQRKHMTNTGTQMTPPPVHRDTMTETSTEHSSCKDDSIPLPNMETLSSTEPSSSKADSLPLQHIEPNVVSLKVIGPSSEDSSIPSSYERDYMRRSVSPRKISPKGKENTIRMLSDKTNTMQVGESVELDIDQLQIPKIKPLTKVDGPIMRPRDHHRGRRGAIVEKLSPPAVGLNAPSTDLIKQDATDTTSS